MQGGSSNSDAERVTLLEIERSGGAPGLFLRLRIDEDGGFELHRPPQPRRHGVLEPGLLAALRSQVAGAHFGSLSSAYFMADAARPDGHAWRIRHGQRTVSTRDGEAPRGLTQLMRAIDGVIDTVELDGELAPSDA